MAVKLKWYADLKAESDLERMGIEKEVEEIPFGRIDFKESQINGARLNDAIRDHKVEDYMEGFRNGDTFPRIIVRKAATGYVILSGNQRCEAIRRLVAEDEVPKNVSIEAYVVSTKDKLLLDLIAKTANVAHGEGDSKEERLAHACSFVRGGISSKDAGRYFMVSESGIRIRIKSEDERKSWMRAGIETAHLPNSVIEPVSKLHYDEPAKMKLATLISRHKPTAERVRQVVATVTSQKTGPSRLEKIKTFEKELADAAHAMNGHKRTEETQRVPLRPRRDKAIRLLSSLVNFLDSENDGQGFTSFDELQLASEQDRERVTSLCKKLQHRLRVILK